MTKEERQAAIRKVLEDEPFVTVAELAIRFDTSESTIRRDLGEMAQQGLIRRTHGGAVSQLTSSEQAEPPSPAREMQEFQPADTRTIESSEIGRIASVASRLIGDGETIILDSGPGMLALARLLMTSRRNLTVLTNSIEVALELSGPIGVSAILTGGLVRNLQEGLVGYVAEQTLRGMQVDRLLLTAPGIDLERGLTTSHLEEINIKQAMIAAAQEVILMAEHSLFGKVALVPFAPLTDVHKIVTGRGLSAEMIAAISKKNIETILA